MQEGIRSGPRAENRSRTNRSPADVVRINEVERDLYIRTKRHASRRSPVGGNPDRPIGRAAGSKQSGEGFTKSVIWPYVLRHVP